MTVGLHSFDVVFSLFEAPFASVDFVSLKPTSGQLLLLIFVSIFLYILAKVAVHAFEVIFILFSFVFFVVCLCS